MGHIYIWTEICRNRVNPFRRQQGLIRGKFQFHKGLQTGLAQLEAHPGGAIILDLRQIVSWHAETIPEKVKI